MCWSFVLLEEGKWRKSGLMGGVFKTSGGAAQVLVGKRAARTCCFDWLWTQVGGQSWGLAPETEHCARINKSFSMSFFFFFLPWCNLTSATNCSLMPFSPHINIICSALLAWFAHDNPAPNPRGRRFALSSPAKHRCRSRITFWGRVEKKKEKLVRNSGTDLVEVGL